MHIGIMTAYIIVPSQEFDVWHLRIRCHVSVLHSKEYENCCGFVRGKQEVHGTCKITIPAEDTIFPVYIRQGHVTKKWMLVQTQVGSDLQSAILLWVGDWSTAFNCGSQHHFNISLFALTVALIAVVVKRQISLTHSYMTTKEKGKNRKSTKERHFCKVS